MNAAGDAIARLLMLREAIASVALSHAPDCICLTCRASHGDTAAFARIASDLAYMAAPVAPEKETRA